MSVSESIIVHTTSIVLSVLILVVIFYLAMRMTGVNTMQNMNGKTITPGTPITPNAPVADIPFFDGTNLTVQF